jgi:hypothetical protein
VRRARADLVRSTGPRKRSIRIGCNRNSHAPAGLLAPIVDHDGSSGPAIIVLSQALYQAVAIRELRLILVLVIDHLDKSLREFTKSGGGSHAVALQLGSTRKRDDSSKRPLCL